MCCSFIRNYQHATRILDGTRASDGAFVTLKLVNRRDHPHEVDIARYFSSKALAESANHCVPVYNVLSVPDEEDTEIIVMPLLRDYTYPPFGTFGEAVECVRQLFEVWFRMFKSIAQSLTFARASILCTSTVLLIG